MLRQRKKRSEYGRGKDDLNIEKTAFMIYNRLQGERSASRHKKYGELAQLGARMTGSHEVTGSTPVFSTSLNMKARLKH